MPAGFGAYIKTLRESSGMKQRAIAEAIGMSQSQYSGMENNANPEYLPAPGIVRGLSRVFGVTEADLLRAAGYLTDSEATVVSAPPPQLPVATVQRVIENLVTFDNLLMQALDEARQLADDIEQDEEQARREAVEHLPLRARRKVAG
jgi:transcriptional regulator with XRE-family HTH domain